MITVNPSPIPAGGPAKISHGSSNTKVINISNGNGNSVSITVPPNTTVNWTPPDGWADATFRDNDGRCAEVFRFIESAGEAGE